MDRIDPLQTVDGLSRRSLLKATGAFGLLSGVLLTGCGTGSTPNARPPASSGLSDAPDPEAALQEGSLVVWHNDQEPDMVEFLAGFTAATGINAAQQKIAPAEALPKLRLEEQAGVTDVDVFLASPDVQDQLRRAEMLLQYVSPVLEPYEPRFKSNPEGFWTAYMVNVSSMIYIPGAVSEQDAPQRYEDLLDPRWKDQMVFAGPTSATGYTWWYTLRDIVGDGFFEELAAQRPAAYPSSTAMLADLVNGNKKLAPGMSIFQVAKAKRANEPLAFSLDSRGVPTSFNTACIIGSTKRPNAAKLFQDYLLSEAGQKAWNSDLQGSYSPLPSIVVPELPAQSDLKLLVPEDLDSYTDPAVRAEFESVWSHVVGLT